METTWRDLIVTDDEGDTDNLGIMVDIGEFSLSNITLANGRIQTWDNRYISAPGEEPEWDTPRVPVNWDGFADSLKLAQIR